MPVQARRVFRLSFTVALSLAAAYALQVPLPFLAPLFAVMLTAAPNPPLGPRQLAGLIVIVLLTMGIGLLLTPMLDKYPVSAVLLVSLGVYFSMYLVVGKDKLLLGTFLAIGMTLMTAAGVVSLALATTVIKALAMGIGLAIICHWLVYPWFPEDNSHDDAPASAFGTVRDSKWIAVRATLIVMPAYLLTLTNPMMYLPLIMKSIALGQQSSVVDARNAGRALLGSTLTGGMLAILFWVLLDLVTNLWMFALWMLLFGVYLAGKLYHVFPGRHSEAYWKDVWVTILLLLGPAVEDSANGDDVYAAFFVRISLFIVVTLYAWFMIAGLEHLRERKRVSHGLSDRQLEQGI